MVRSLCAPLMIVFAIAAGWLAAGEFSGTLSAEESPPRSGASPSATRQEVWRAVVVDLSERGFQEEQWPRAEDLDLPGSFSARPGGKFRVLSACWDERPERTQFRLECGVPGECLPFLVYLPWKARYQGDPNPGAHVHSCRLASGSRPPPEASPKLAIRPGDRARAVFLSAGLRMTASVICLDRGREGEVIRVRAVDGHIFRARISGPGMLEALQQ